jgi:hypothetical protein
MSTTSAETMEREGGENQGYAADNQHNGSDNPGNAADPTNYPTQSINIHVNNICRDGSLSNCNHNSTKPSTQTQVSEWRGDDEFGGDVFDVASAD